MGPFRKNTLQRSIALVTMQSLPNNSSVIACAPYITQQDWENAILATVMTG